MDNLERSAGQPADPAQPVAGRRPQRQLVLVPADASPSSILQETPTNKVLKYTGGDLKAWTGVTLAFLGGNGAGTCYDATAYKGIRFKIKGTVTAPTDPLLNGKVVVSLISAETQIQKYGGDLKDPTGMGGGHFNFIVPVTGRVGHGRASPGTMFEKPTWGATTDLPAPALSKLQAIDWGVSNLAAELRTVHRRRRAVLGRDPEQGR